MEYTLKKMPSIGMSIVNLNEKIVNTIMIDGNKRAIGTINGQLKFHCAFLNSKSEGYYVMISSKICKQLNLKIGQKLVITFEIDTSENQFETSEELNAVLDSDVEASSVYASLTDGKKRSIVYLMGLVKSSDKKIERALLIAEKLKMGITSAKLIMKK
jgi:hypothetical protein